MSHAAPVPRPVEEAAHPRVRSPRRDWAPMEALMTAVAEGDDRSFQPLFHLLEAHIRRFLLSMMRDVEVVEDLVQKTFLKLWRARGQYVLGAPLKPWALAIARRTMLDEMRKMRRSRVRLTADGVLPEPTPEPSLPGVGASAIDNRHRDALVLGLTRLTEIQSEAIRLVGVEDLSLAEAARAAGTTVAAMKVRIHRAYKVIRKTYETRSPPRVGADELTGVREPPRATTARRHPKRASCELA